jgi:hypothetical protein
MDYVEQRQSVRQDRSCSNIATSGLDGPIQCIAPITRKRLYTPEYVGGLMYDTVIAVITTLVPFPLNLEKRIVRNRSGEPG